MVYQPFADDGDSLEAPVRVRRKARHHVAVVHAPTVLAAEILANGAAREGGGRAHLRVGLRVGIIVVGAKQERILGFPRETQWFDLEDGLGRHSKAFKRRI